MSESHRDQDSMSNTSFSQNHRNSKDQFERNNRKRSHLDTENLDAKVYIGNVPTDKLTDDELLELVKPFGKVSDIRVFKDHIIVQYNRIDDAKRLLTEAKVPMICKGNQLDILPARDVRSTSTKSSSALKRRGHERNLHRSSSNSESTRKRTHFDRMESNTRRSSNENLPRYSILSGSKNDNDLIDCQIILVNTRQREYAEEIQSRLRSHGLLTSIILLREDYSLVEAIENAARLNCLYGIIIMPMHEERRTASFHILYGQTEEHRNLALEDGIHIILTNFMSYKERLQKDQINPYRPNHEPATSTSEYHHPNHENTNNPPMLTLADKLPLSMLLCLLADGRQLTLEEIDRVLVYLLEKKAKMLTLPAGTLPPLPAQYAIETKGSTLVIDTSPTSTDISSTLAEQIRQLISSNTDTLSTTLSSQTSLEKLSDIVKIENGNLPSMNSLVKDTTTEYIRQPTQSPFAFPKNEALPAVISPFNISASGSVNSFPTPNFSSFNPSMTLNSTSKSSTSVPVTNFLSQTPQYFYPVSSTSVYPSTITDATAAILQAYSQFNVQPSTTTNTIHQQASTQHPLRK